MYLEKGKIMQSKRERFFLLGAVPVLAAAAGSIATVLGQKYVGAAPESDVILAIIKMQGVSAAEKTKLLELANHSTDKFYGFLQLLFIGVAAPLAALITSIGRRIGG